MILSLKWLREFVPFEGTAQELGDRLTMLGLENEAISRPFAEIEEVEEELLEFGEARGLNTESLASLYAYAKKNEFTFINFEENYEKISKEDIEYIEFKTREIISLISPEIVYFSVSHSDQDSFHIHRIIKK